MEGVISEIRLFAGNFAPKYWAFCHGQSLLISQNTSLYSLLGTTYGGDGRATFALPDLRGRVAIKSGTGVGLPTYKLGQMDGSENITLNLSQLPSHTHTSVLNTTVSNFRIHASDQPGTLASPANNFPATENSGGTTYAESAASGETLNVSEFAGDISTSVTVQNTGGGQFHNNLQPLLTLHYIICLEGIYPKRS